MSKTVTLYLISTGFSSNTQERIALLETACQQRGIPCVILESTSADRLALPTLQPGDALYNATREGLRLEEELWRPGVATFYTAGPPLGLQDTTRWLAAHSRAGLAQPRTVAHATADRALLARYAEHLGGYPLVLKTAGGTLGTGVMRVDSHAALLSLADYLVATGANFLLREYLESTGTARLMVVGNEVVGALEYDNPPADFRSNAAPDLHPRLVSVSAEAEALAVAAVHTAGVEMGGVDLLYDQQGCPQLLEMNIPCGFATFPKLGIDVPGRMVEHLFQKASLLRHAHPH